MIILDAEDMNLLHWDLHLKILIQKHLRHHTVSLLVVQAVLSQSCFLVGSIIVQQLVFLTEYPSYQYCS